MFSLASQSEETRAASTPLSNPSDTLIAELTAEIAHLRQVIALKDQTLEEIRKLVDRSFAQKQPVHTYGIVEKGIKDAAREKYSEGLRKALSYEISAEIDESIGDSLSSIRDDFQRILQHHETSQQIVQAQYAKPRHLSADSKRLQLVEIPVEIRLLADTISAGVQVDLFETPKNSERVEREAVSHVSNEFVPIIREYPVELELYYDVPVEVYVEREAVEPEVETAFVEGVPLQAAEGSFDGLSQQNQSLKGQISANIEKLKHTQQRLECELSQLSQLQRTVEFLQNENASLKEHITRLEEEPYSLEIQITAPYVTVPLDQNNSVEVPIEIELDNQASGVKMEIVQEDELATEVVQNMESAIPNLEETRPNITSEASLHKPRQDFATRSEISDENRPSPLNKENSIVLSEQSNPSRSPEVIIVQLPTELIIVPDAEVKCIQLPVELIHCIEVPVEVKVEVPVEVIREVKVEVIREVQVEVVKYVEVPVEKIKYIEVPIATVEEVEVYSIMPVEVEVETERFVQVPVLHEVPIELIIIQDPDPKEQPVKLNSAVPEEARAEEDVELDIELEIDEASLPVRERIVEVEKIVERVVQVEVERIVKVQVEKVVEKVVYVNQPVEVIKEVFVERPVEVIKEVFVEKIVEVPIEVLIERVIEYETVIETVNEVTIEKTHEVIIDHNVIFEIPVEVEIDRTASQRQSRIQQTPPELQAEPEPEQSNAQEEEYEIQITDIEFILEQEPVTHIVEKIIEKIVEVPVEVIITQVVEVIKEVEVPKIVEVERIREVEKVVQVEVVKTVEVEVLKVVEVPVIQIVEVPVELQQEVKIIERYMPYLVEVPVELKTSSVVEVPVEMHVEPMVYEVPIDVINAVEVLEIPLEMQEPVVVLEVPVEMNVLECERVESPRGRRKASGDPINEECDSPTTRLAADNLNHQPLPSDPAEQVFLIPLNIEVTEIEIEVHPQADNQIIVEIPYEIELNQDEGDRKSEQAKQDKQEQGKEARDVAISNQDQEIFDALKCLESAPKPVEVERRAPHIQIIEVPIELEVDNSEELRKALEHKYRDRINDLHAQYSAEISSLHQMLHDLQSIILESQQEREHLKDELEAKALQEESLHSRIIALEESIRGMEDEVRDKEDATTKLAASNQEQAELYEELKSQFVTLSKKFNELQDEPPIVYEMAVEMVVKTEYDSRGAQTDDLLLPNEISVIEVPIQIEVVEKISDSSLRKSDEDEVKSSSTSKYFKGYTEEQLYEKLKAMAVKAELVDRFTQTERESMDELDFQIKPDHPMNITEMFEYPYKDKNDSDHRIYKYNAEMEQSLQDHLISGIESAEEYETAIDFKIYEYAVEVIPEPIIYEVAVDVKVFRELAISEVQTETPYDQVVIQKEICEVPIELNLKKQTAESCIQTEAEDKADLFSVGENRHQVVTTQVYENKLVEGDVLVSRGGLFSSNAQQSKLIEIPIELNIEVEKETISIDIQTKETWNEPIRQDRKDVVKDSVSSKLRITPVLEQIHVASAHLPEITKGNPYETNVVRLESACFSIPEHRIVDLASNNQSITYEQFYQNLADTHKFFDSNSNNKNLVQSADIRDFVSHDVINEEQEAYSRVVVHVDNNEMQFHEIEELKEAVAKGSDIKPSYSDLYDNINEVERYRTLIQQLEEENLQLKEELENSQYKLEEEIKKLTNNNAILEKTVDWHERTIEQHQSRQAEFSSQKLLEEKRIEKLEEEYERMKEYNVSLEFSSNKEIDRLRTIINDRLEEIKELKIEERQAKEMYEAEILNLRASLTKREERIEELELEERKNQNAIDSLLEYQEELRKTVAHARHDHENNAAALYEQEFERIKDDFEDKKRRLQDQILSHRQEIDSLKEELEDEYKRSKAVAEEARELEAALGKAQEEYSVLAQVKSELEFNYIENLKEFHHQLEECRELITEKDKVIHQLQANAASSPASPEKLKTANPEVAEQPQPIRMEYLSRKVSREFQDPRFISTYIQKLQKLLLRYEKIMEGNEATIEELQEKVCEYLRDALEKEQEADMLYSKLVEYECAMNNILVEKITLEIENKRMTKAVELSERKVLILGNKLIDAVGRRQAHESEDSDYYYQ